MLSLAIGVKCAVPSMMYGLGYGYRNIPLHPVVMYEFLIDECRMTWVVF